MKRKPAPAGQARQPKVAQGGGVQLAVFKTIPAPIGGWNRRDPLAAMDPRDAVELSNWFPRVADCAVRGGCEEFATGFATQPKTLAVYNGQNGVNKLFAANSSGIYDCSAGGAIGAAAIARTEGYHSWVQMAVSGGAYLIMCNGVDKPAYFDGTNWTAVDGVSTPALTGVTTTTLVSCNVYKRRLFFLQEDKLNFYYLAADAIGGALTEFLLGPLCARGGYTMAMGTWTMDGGQGPDDYAVFVTSEGEAVVFTGTNPSDVNSWSLVGVYFVGKPLGRRCFKKYGGDLILITQYGAFPLSKAVQAATINFKLALTNKIEGAFIEAADNYGDYSGWMCEIFPAQGAFIFNIPTAGDNSSAEQYVMNTTTRSWCKFTGWNAADFVEYNKELYFADQTVVAKCWTTFADYGENITAAAQTAFNHHKDPRVKDWNLFRPMLRTNGPLTFSVGVAVDFETTPTLSTASYTTFTGGRWDVALWDASYWAAGLEVQLDWSTPGAKPGTWGAGLLTVATNSIEIQWAASDYTYVVGALVT